MEPTRPSDLLIALGSLKVMERELKSENTLAPFVRATPLPRLESAIARLGSDRPARPPLTPERFLTQWKNHVQGDTNALEPRALRFLCWEPDIATDERFLQHLFNRQHTPNARTLQGLVRSFHARWGSPQLTQSTLRKVRDAVLAYRGPNRVLEEWQRSIDLIISVAAAERMGDRITVDLIKPPDLPSRFKIEERTPFVIAALREALDRCRDKIAQSEPTLQFVFGAVFRWAGWEVDELKKQCNLLILHRDAERPEIADAICHFASQHPNIGDPRLPANTVNWYGFSDQSRRRVIAWLSRADISFFFEHAFSNAKDRHGRKPFWLQYVGKIQRSRPLLADREYFALARTLFEQRRATVGRMSGANCAFVLDFGSVVAVEFNMVGACHIYSSQTAAEVLPDFWTSKSIGESQLKDKSACVPGGRISHFPGWQHDLANVLARHGIHAQG